MISSQDHNATGATMFPFAPRKENKLNIMRIVLFTTILGTFCVSGNALSGGNTLSDVIGDVAATLLKSSIDDPSGPEMPAKVARSWTNAVLSKTKQMPEDSVPKFQFRNKAKYDAVGFEFVVSGQVIITKQTNNVMVISFPNQSPEGKTNEQLSAMLDTMATAYLSGIEHRHFIPAGEIDGTKVFSLVIEEGYKTGDWRDKITGTIKNGIISFSFLKEKLGGSAVIMGDPESNKAWFEISSKGYERTR
jgi:hypothetical protein